MAYFLANEQARVPLTRLAEALASEALISSGMFASVITESLEICWCRSLIIPRKDGLIPPTPRQQI